MECWLGYIISLVSGGIAGALINRYFLLKDKSLKKLTLKTDHEEVKSIIPVQVDGVEYNNLIYKKYTLVNTTNKDFPELDVVFEFDKDSVIIKKIVSSKKHGKNKYEFTDRKQSEVIYHVKNYIRKQKITFEFEIGSITENFFCAIIDNCGVEITIVPTKKINQTKIAPGRIVDKLDLE